MESEKSFEEIKNEVEKENNIASESNFSSNVLETAGRSLNVASKKTSKITNVDIMEMLEKMQGVKSHDEMKECNNIDQAVANLLKIADFINTFSKDRNKDIAIKKIECAINLLRQK